MPTTIPVPGPLQPADPLAGTRPAMPPPAPPPGAPDATTPMPMAVPGGAPIEMGGAAAAPMPPPPAPTMMPPMAPAMVPVPAGAAKLAADALDAFVARAAGGLQRRVGVTGRGADGMRRGDAEGRGDDAEKRAGACDSLLSIIRDAGRTHAFLKAAQVRPATPSGQMLDYLGRLGPPPVPPVMQPGGPAASRNFAAGASGMQLAHRPITSAAGALVGKPILPGVRGPNGLLGKPAPSIAPPGTQGIGMTAPAHKMARFIIDNMGAGHARPIIDNMGAGHARSIVVNKSAGHARPIVVNNGAGHARPIIDNTTGEKSARFGVDEGAIRPARRPRPAARFSGVVDPRHPRPAHGLRMPSRAALLVKRALGEPPAGPSAGAAPPAPGGEAPKKTSQEKAGYQPATTPARSCAMCVHFDGRQGCDVVEGPVDPTGTSQLFQARPEMAHINTGAALAAPGAAPGPVELGMAKSGGIGDAWRGAQGLAARAAAPLRSAGAAGMGALSRAGNAMRGAAYGVGGTLGGLAGEMAVGGANALRLAGRAPRSWEDSARAAADTAWRGAQSGFTDVNNALSARGNYGPNSAVSAMTRANQAALRSSPGTTLGLPGPAAAHAVGGADFVADTSANLAAAGQAARGVTAIGRRIAAMPAARMAPQLGRLPGGAGVARAGRAVAGFADTLGSPAGRGLARGVPAAGRAGAGYAGSKAYWGARDAVGEGAGSINKEGAAADALAAVLEKLGHYPGCRRRRRVRPRMRKRAGAEKAAVTGLIIPAGMVAGALGGGVAGARMAPPGHAIEGFDRGLRRGRGAGILGMGGGVLGGAIGGLAGPLGVAPGALLGAGLGGLAGNAVAGWALGPPSYQKGKYRVSGVGDPRRLMGMIGASPAAVGGAEVANQLYTDKALAPASGAPLSDPSRPGDVGGVQDVVDRVLGAHGKVKVVPTSEIGQNAAYVKPEDVPRLDGALPAPTGAAPGQGVILWNPEAGFGRGVAAHEAGHAANQEVHGRLSDLAQELGAHGAVASLGAAAAAPLIPSKKWARRTALAGSAVQLPRLVDEAVASHRGGLGLASGHGLGGLGEYLHAFAGVPTYALGAAMPLASYGLAGALGRWRGRPLAAGRAHAGHAHDGRAGRDADSDGKRGERRRPPVAAPRRKAAMATTPPAEKHACGCGCGACKSREKKIKTVGPERRESAGKFAWRGRGAVGVASDPGYARYTRQGD